MSSGLELRQLTVRAGAFRLETVTLQIAPGRILVLLGPSGAGKTVLIETIAGFRRPLSGQIVLDGRDLASLPAEARRIGLVFQQYALFPHLSVLGNVRFGLRARGERSAEPARAMLARLGIAGLAPRRPANLSGGEQQRVALARALVTDPRLVLLDEPLAALDAPTRDGLRDELGRTLRAAGVPALYVTHDQIEAHSLADDVAVLIGGRLRQAGPVQALFDAPADTDVARFLGLEQLGPAAPAGGCSVTVCGVRLHVTGKPPAAGGLVAMYRAEDVQLSPATEAADAVNTLRLTVKAVVSLGPVVRVELAGPLAVAALVFRGAVPALNLRPGQPVCAALPPASLRLVPVAGVCSG